MTRTVAVPLPEVAQGRAVVVVEAEGERLLVCRSPTGLHVVRDRCPHQDVSMDGARVRGESVICPHHGARFSLADGRSLSPITPKPVTILPCRVAGDRLEVNL